MKRNYIVSAAVLLVISLLALAGCKGEATKDKAAAPAQAKAQQYTCPMHPEIVRDKPGKCPICGMDLVSKQAAGGPGAIDSSLAQLVKPVNEQVVAQTTTIVPESGMRIFSVPVQGVITYDTRRQTSMASRVGGRIERMYIKYNYQPVKKGQLLMEIYSPDLAAAQRELLYLTNQDSNSELVAKARQRLQLLGMQPAQISQVIRTGKVLYRIPVYSSASGYILDKSAATVSPASVATATTQAPGSGSDMGGMGGMGNGSSGGGSGSSTGTSPPSLPAENSPVLLREGQYVTAGQSIFTIYNNSTLVAEFALTPAQAAQVKRGQKLVFQPSSDPQAVYTGSIGLIQPTFRSGQNFTLARVYISDARLRVGQLLSANVPIVSRGWWVPQSAVLQLGTQAVVFKKEGAVFVPKRVTQGMVYEGLVQITEGVSGWEIAKNAAYLVDSESFIRISSENQTQE